MEETHTSEVQKPVAVLPAQNSLLKDLLIPISIVLAGLAIGAGLYFSGGTAAQPLAAQPAGTQPVAQADTTDKVNPVTPEDHIKGDIDAPIMIVEYSDFDCPFCGRFHDVMNTIVAANDDVAWVYRQFPIEQLHPQAPAVAVASECVAKLGGNDAFWVFADGYFASRQSGTNVAHDVLVPQLAATAGVDAAAFTTCFESGETLPAVQADLTNASETGGRGTPWSILIGPSGKTYPINGALPQQAIEQLIEIARQEA